MTDPAVLERIGHGPLRLERTPYNGCSAVWRRRYPCGVLSDERQVEATTEGMALAEVMAWEDQADETDREYGVPCLICFPEDGDA